MKLIWHKESIIPRHTYHMILTFWNKFSLTLYMYKEKKKKTTIITLWHWQKTFSGRYGEQTMYFILWLFSLVQKLFKAVWFLLSFASESVNIIFNPRQNNVKQEKILNQNNVHVNTTVVLLHCINGFRNWLKHLVFKLQVLLFARTLHL